MDKRTAEREEAKQKRAKSSVFAVSYQGKEAKEAVQKAESVQRAKNAEFAASDQGKEALKKGESERAFAKVAEVEARADKKYNAARKEADKGAQAKLKEAAAAKLSKEVKRRRDDELMSAVNDTTILTPFWVFTMVTFLLKMDDLLQRYAAWVVVRPFCIQFEALQRLCRAEPTKTPRMYQWHPEYGKPVPNSSTTKLGKFCLVNYSPPPLLTPHTLSACLSFKMQVPVLQYCSGFHLPL